MTYSGPVLNDGVARGDPWFSDGNILLTTRENPTAFLLHRGVLARHSEVFNGMFQIPQPSNGNDTCDGYQVVEMQDLPWDLSNLIKALYDGANFKNRNSDDFFYLASILRLSTKYFISHLRLQAIRFLTETWAYTLKGHDEMVERAINSPILDVITYPYIHPLHVLNLAREVDITLVIPSALYFLSLYPLADILKADHPKLTTVHPAKPSSTLALTDTREYTLMYQFRIDLILDFIRRVCGEETAKIDCPNNCIRGFARNAARLSRSWSPRTGPFHFMLQATTEASDEPMICAACHKVFRQNVDRYRTESWERLPGVLGLPSWAEMEALDLKPDPP